MTRIARPASAVARAAVATLVLLGAGRAGAAPEEGLIAGSWLANGTRHAFDFGPGRDVATVELGGHLHLQNPIGGVKEFWAQCVGLWDSETGAVVRCSWRASNGGQVLVVLSGRPLEQGQPIEGELVGGTGPFAGIRGELRYVWDSVLVEPEEGLFTGSARRLSGSFRLP